MSVTFFLTRCGEHIKNPSGDIMPSACLCAQFAPTWDMDLAHCDLAVLRAHALPTCHICAGTGVESGSLGYLSINLCNANAVVLLRMLQLPTDVLHGTMAMPEVRRAIMRARALFETLAPQLTRDESLSYGHDHSVRVVRYGLDVTGIRRHVETLHDLILQGIQAEADHLTWG